jgi:signal peptidase I
MTTRDTATTFQPQLDLTVEILRSGNSVRLKALGSSMLPALWPDDVLTVEPVAATAVRPGDILLCMRDGRFVIHRLIRCRNEEWTTRGDAMPVCDPPFQANQVLGRVMEIRRGRHILQAGSQTLFQRLAGWILCRFDVCRRFALRLHSLRQEFWQETDGLHEPEQLARVRTIW